MPVWRGAVACLEALRSYVASRESLPSSWRFDFVAVELDARGKPKRIELIENAIGY